MKFHVTSRVVTEVELAIKPESVALGAFGAIAALVALVLGIQAISRQLRWGDEDRRVLRALGAGPVAAAGDGLIGVLAAVLLGSLLAVAVAVGLSPLAPLGPVRPVYPNRGSPSTGRCSASGSRCWSSASDSPRSRSPTERHLIGSDRTQSAPSGESSITRGAESAGVPVAGAMGVRFALEPGRGRTAVPVRSALLGTVLAVALLVAHPHLRERSAHLGVHPVALRVELELHAQPEQRRPPPGHRSCSTTTPTSPPGAVRDYSDLQIDGQTVPILMSAPRPAVSPPILSGHGLDGDDQIVLGAATLAVLAQARRRHGDVSYGAPDDPPIYIPPTPLVIVGTATFPAVGFSSFVADHTSMGTGALCRPGIVPLGFQQALLSPDPNLNGPELVFVRLRTGVGATAGRANLQHIADAANKIFAADPNGAGNNVTVLGVQRPVQIVNYRSIGSTPVVLAVGLALGAIVALGLTLVASVRHRRRDLALLKALGFTPRQLAAVVAWQATVTAAGRRHRGHPGRDHPRTPALDPLRPQHRCGPRPHRAGCRVILVGLGALVFANLVAALPGRIAARTPTALVLRAE